MGALIKTPASEPDVLENLIYYLAGHFGDKVWTFVPSTNVYERYLFNPNSWIQFGNTLSELPWVEALEVILTATDMANLVTVGGISQRIWDKHQGGSDGAPTMMTVQTASVGSRLRTRRRSVKKVRKISARKP